MTAIRLDILAFLIFPSVLTRFHLKTVFELFLLMLKSVGRIGAKECHSSGALQQRIPNGNTLVSLSMFNLGSKMRGLGAKAQLKKNMLGFHQCRKIFANYLEMHGLMGYAGSTSTAKKLLGG
ncbi:hypothetical protein BAR1_13845 [Profundibacter amoris]|uniref:Uncharacterized protein n=1 Tax=Profundibacter amoris TaxID=2171755 RepID=A0A347UJ86_9RHOB|nr:hypothetical protein BAR1_13845 [Profundibacter amoris]